MSSPTIENALSSARALSSYTDTDWSTSIQSASPHIKPSTTKTPLADPSPRFLAQTIDHTLLKLDATEAQITTLCKEAAADEFKSVCVRLPWVPHCARLLASATPIIACVVGFHEGTHPTADKLSEAIAAVRAGAAELDVVLNYPLLQAGKYTEVFEELAAIRIACPAPTVLKIIFETAQLSEAEILAACQVAAAAGFDFVKTSTGFNGRGASVRDVQLMRAAAVFYAGGQGREVLRKVGGGLAEGLHMKVKASGGVRTFADAVAMLEVGAERIGASSGVKIVQEAKNGGKAADGTAAGGDGY